MSGEQFDVKTEENQKRHAFGLGVLESVDGEAGDRLLAALGEVAPDMVHHISAFAYGDIYARPGLVPRDRQLVTLGALTAMGGTEGELRIHIGTALTTGLTAEEIVEALIHSTLYCGFPRAINALLIAKEVFAEHGLLPVKNSHES
jgi:4-carboxymuconolactone decarboxylase